MCHNYFGQFGINFSNRSKSQLIIYFLNSYATVPDFNRSICKCGGGGGGGGGGHWGAFLTRCKLDIKQNKTKTVEIGDVIPLADSSMFSFNKRYTLCEIRVYII